jgi:hypothetical protein
MPETVNSPRTPDPTATLTRADVARELRSTPETVSLWLDQGRIVPPRRLPNRTLRWLRCELDAWLRSLPQRDPKPAEAGA